MIHLHLHSTYSILDGYGTPEQYADTAVKLGQKAIAVTDHGNVCAHRSWEKACKARSVKPIYGCELYVRNKPRHGHLTALAATDDGYRNLLRLVSLSNTEGHLERRPLLDINEIAEHQQGIIFLSGCYGAGLPHLAYKESPERAYVAISDMRRKIDNLFIEIQHTDPAETELFRSVGQMLRIPCIPTFDVHYPRPENYKAQDLMFCIGQKRRLGDAQRMKYPETLFMHSTTEAMRYFTEAEIQCTDMIAEQCNVTLPRFKPMVIENARDRMIALVAENSKRLPALTDAHRAQYRHELEVIDRLGLHTYFVLMAEVIMEFKRRGRMVGHARGSSAGSVIAYLLGITEIDPIRYGLSFERFLDVHRTDYPDIDTDFPQEVRGEIAEWLQQKYGRDHVARLTTFITYKGSGVFWDIARAASLDRALVGKITQEIPQIVNDEVDMDDIMQIPAVSEAVSKWPVFKYAAQLEGQTKTVGQHASGYLICPVPIQDAIGMMASKDGLVAAADKDQAESAGLLKLDILGLNTLDIIEDVMRECHISNDALYRMEPNDPAVFEAFNNGTVAATFQMEGGAVRNVLRDIKVESIEDLAFVSAVARPGASTALKLDGDYPEQIKQFIYKGRYLVYQEELMRILKWLDFDDRQVTHFRKMVSKKKLNVLESDYHDLFVQRCEKRGVIRAEHFWSVIQRTGAYAFNKSHAIAYAHLSYLTMWMKLCHREAFAKAYLNRTEDNEKRRAFLREGWTVKLYDPENISDRFNVKGNTVTGGLTSIKGVGIALLAKHRSKPHKFVMNAIERARAMPHEYAPWSCLEDFGNRFKIGSLPRGEYMVTARVWDVKDGMCVMEDKNGAEKAYYDPRFVKIEKGKAYRFAVTKFRYAKIDSARMIE